MAQVNWGTIGTVVHLLTTELNSLADGSGTVPGPQIDNSGGPQTGTLLLTIASNSLAFIPQSYVRVFFLPAIDGTHYPTYTSGASYKLADGNYLAATMSVNPVTQSANVVYESVGLVVIPPGKYKAALASALTVTMPASGNALDLYPTPTSIV